MSARMTHPSPALATALLRAIHAAARVQAVAVANESTPTYDRLVCESIEREEWPMTDWKPGDVALSEFCGEENVRVVRYEGGWARLADTDDYIPDEPILGTHGVENPRRLVVVDPEDREQVERLCDIYDYGGSKAQFVSRLQAALREFANPKPPKPDEPQGLGAVVEDADGALWVRVGVTIGNLHWRSTEPGNTNCFKWQAIDAVRVLSEGVQP